MSYRFGLLVILIVIALALPPYATAATTYTVTDLGTLGGTSSYGSAIGEDGSATGYSEIAGGGTRAFIWTVGNGMQSLGVIGGGDSRGLDISGDNIVGQTSGQAFRWTPGTGMVLIDSANQGSAAGLNANKEAVGYRVAGSASRVRTWTAADVAGNPYPLADLRGIAVNDLGQFVATNTSGSASVYSPGSGLTTALGGGGFVATDINNSRDIAGSVGGIAAHYVFDSGTVSGLGKLSPTDTFSKALGINSAGNLVGLSQGSGAFIVNFENQIMVSLTSLLHPDYAGWHITVADDINDAGQIVGVGQFGGVSHAVILTPVPEPTTLVLSAIAGLAMLLAGFRSSRQRSA